MSSSNPHNRYADRPLGLVSIIIPNHNRDKLLFDAIESCRAQTYPDVEIVVVDDGSHDEIRQSIRSRLRDIHTHTHPLRYVEIAKQGVCAARNVGIRSAAGRYLQFLDSDDLLHPEKIKRSMEIFAGDPNIDCVYGDRLNFEINEAGQFLASTPSDCGPDLEKHPSAAEAVLRSLWTSLPVATRDLIDLTGPWNESLTSNEDWEYGFRLARAAHRIRHAPGAMAYCRQHRGVRASKMERGHAPSIISLVRASLAGLRELNNDRSGLGFRARARLIRNIVSAFKVSAQTRQCRLLLTIAGELCASGRSWLR